LVIAPEGPPGWDDYTPTPNTDPLAIS
jgi:hypothetical protein